MPFIRKLFSGVLGLGVLIFFVSTRYSFAGEIEVPSEYKELYSLLEGKIADFNSYLNSNWDGRKSNVVFGAELLGANGNSGEKLFNEEYYKGIILYMDHLKLLGVQGVKISMQFPILTPDYPGNEKYLQVYKKIAGELRQRNMKLLVSMGYVFPYPFSTLPNPYKGITFEKYKEMLRNQVKIIVKEIRPDYLTFINEPSTLNMLAGVNFTVENLTEAAQYVLDGLDRQGVLIGAGAGNWDDPGYFENWAKETSVDYIDLHIYPVNRDFLERCVKYADIAKKYNKKIIVGESWLYKSGDNELADAGVGTNIMRRDGFSFWQPLDQKHIEIIVKLSHWKEFIFISFFWSKHFFGYIDYSDMTKNLPADQVMKLGNRVASGNILSKKFSPTGLAYQKLIQAK